MVADDPAGIVLAGDPTAAATPRPERRAEPRRRPRDGPREPHDRRLRIVRRPRPDGRRRPGHARVADPAVAAGDHGPPTGPPAPPVGPRGGPIGGRVAGPRAGPSRAARRPTLGLSTIRARATRLDARRERGTILGRVSRLRNGDASEGAVLPNADTRVESPLDRRIAIPAGERQYHIGLGPGELAEYILLPGDPDRTSRIATRLDSIELEHRHREFATVTGQYRGQRVSVVSTGHRHGQRRDRRRGDPGHHGAAHVHQGRFVRRRSSRRCASATSSSPPAPFASRRRPASSSMTATRPWRTTRRSAPSSRPRRRLGHAHHVGVTATAPGFFGAQGRPIPQLPIRYPDLAEEMARQRVMNFEMEASALLVLAGLAECRAGVVCAVYANRTTGEFVTGDAKDAAEAACVETGLESLLDPRRDGPPETGRGDGSLATVALADRTGHRGSPGGRGTNVPVTLERTEEPDGRGLLRQGQDEGRSRRTRTRITMKNGKPALQGTCPKCGGKVFKIGG